MSAFTGATFESGGARNAWLSGRSARYGSPAEHTLAARATRWSFNRQGAFDNLADTEEGLRQILKESFRTVEIDVVGSVAHFTATGPH